MDTGSGVELVDERGRRRQRMGQGCVGCVVVLQHKRREITNRHKKKEKKTSRQNKQLLDFFHADLFVDRPLSLSEFSNRSLSRIVSNL